MFQVLCWGVRNMKKFQLANVTSPSIVFECGGHLRTSAKIKDTKKNPNFTDSVLFFDVVRNFLPCWLEKDLISSRL